MKLFNKELIAIVEETCKEAFNMSELTDDYTKFMNFRHTYRGDLLKIRIRFINVKATFRLRFNMSTGVGSYTLHQRVPNVVTQISNLYTLLDYGEISDELSLPELRELIRVPILERLSHNDSMDYGIYKAKDGSSKNMKDMDDNELGYSLITCVRSRDIQTYTEIKYILTDSGFDTETYIYNLEDYSKLSENITVVTASGMEFSVKIPLGTSFHSMINKYVVYNKKGMFNIVGGHLTSSIIYIEDPFISSNELEPPKTYLNKPLRKLLSIGGEFMFNLYRVLRDIDVNYYLNYPEVLGTNYMLCNVNILDESIHVRLRFNKSLKVVNFNIYSESEDFNIAYTVHKRVSDIEENIESPCTYVSKSMFSEQPSYDDILDVVGMEVGFESLIKYKPVASIPDKLGEVNNVGLTIYEITNIDILEETDVSDSKHASKKLMSSMPLLTKEVPWLDSSGKVYICDITFGGVTTTVKLSGELDILRYYGMFVLVNSKGDFNIYPLSDICNNFTVSSVDILRLRTIVAQAKIRCSSFK